MRHWDESGRIETIMVRKYITPEGAKKQKKHDPETLQEAIRAIKTGSMTVREAVLQYGVSKSTLHRHANDNDEGRPRGGQTMLSYDLEEEIVQCLCDWGIPLTEIEVTSFVKKYLDTKKITVRRFRNNLPGTLNSVHAWPV